LTPIITQEAAVLFGFDLNQLLTFPFQDEEARKYFLIGCLFCLASFVIPILPWLVVSGYGAILIRQVLQGEKPHLVPWDNWEALLKDGARLFGIRLIYASPLILLMIPLFLLSFAFPLFPAFARNGDSHTMSMFFLVFSMAMTGLFMLMMPLSLAVGLIVPAAEIHVIAKDDFSAGFQVRDWWSIFKKNWGGFVVALALLYAVMMVLSFAMQIMMFTIVLMCLLPFFLPAISMYYTVVHYVAFAQAYRNGRDTLSLETI
jgi:hypothetical protein